MKKSIKIMTLLLAFLFAVSLSACDKVDKNYGRTIDENASQEGKTTLEDKKPPAIMSSDRVMSKYFDISLYDEENYAQLYLGKSFKFKLSVAEDEFTVPTKISKLSENGWNMVEDGHNEENSLIYANDYVDVVFQNANGVKINAIIYNSSNISKKLKECNVVKFKLINNFYTDSEKFTAFNINGINNRMAVTDIIYTLGAPSHFYCISPESYYLDYFISKNDRRNGITVYINPIEDTVTAIEFSYYK